MNISKFFIVFFFWIPLINLLSQEKNQQTKTVYLAEFTPFKSSENRKISKEITSALSEKLSAMGFMVIAVETDREATLAEAKKKNAFLVIAGYYKKVQATDILNLYAQIYNPETGNVLDAVNIEDKTALSGEESLLDKSEMQVSDTKAISDFSIKLSERVRGNKRRTIKRDNIEEYITKSEIASAGKFKLQTETLKSDLEDVLKIFEETEVVTASRKSQKASEAPASIIVITDKDILRKGYPTVLDALRDVTMLDINSPGQGYLLDIGGRGINPNLNMGKYWQILIDGHDMTWRQFYRNYLSPGWLSVENIKRIEIVKGPNSALWGANAVMGVINIITKDAKDTGKGIISGAGGSNSTLAGNITGSGNFGDTGQIYSTLSYFGENVPKKIREWSDRKQDDIYVYGNDSKYINSYTKVKYSDFHLKAMYSSDNSHKAVSQYSVGARQTLFQINKYFLDGGWDKKASEKLDFKVSGYYDFTEWGKDARYEDNPYNPPTTNPANPGKNANGTQKFIQPMRGSDKVTGGRAFMNFDIMKNMSIITGGNYELRETILWHFPETVNSIDYTKPTTYTPVPTIQTYQWGGYLQWSYSPVKQLNFNAGIRRDKDSIFGYKSSPRAGLIFKPSEKLIFKMMHGYAYKAPSLFEQYYARKNETYGNPGLKPELNSTFETQVIYTPLQWLVTKLTVFSLAMENIITYETRNYKSPLYNESKFRQTDRPDGTLTTYRQQINGVNRVRSEGIEGEVDVKPWKFLLFSFNGTYRKAVEERSNKTRNGEFAEVFILNRKTFNQENFTREKTLDYAAKYQYAGSISYIHKEKYTFTLMGRRTGSKGVPSTYSFNNSTRKEDNFKEPGFLYNNPNDTTLRAPAYYVVNFSFHAASIMENLDFLLRIENVANREYYDAGQQVLYHQPERSVFAKVIYHGN